MKQSLEQLLSQLPTYMRDKNDEVYILTIQPSALVDQHSRVETGWIAGYLRFNDSIFWLRKSYKPTVYQAVSHLLKSFICDRHCSEYPLITSDGSKIDLTLLKEGKIKWCAVSRDLLWLFPKNKPKRVWIEGYGVYQVKDVIHKRHKHRIDILLHPKDNKLIYKKHIKIKILK